MVHAATAHNFVSPLSSCCFYLYKLNKVELSKIKFNKCVISREIDGDDIDYNRKYRKLNLHLVNG